MIVALSHSVRISDTEAIALEFSVDYLDVER